MNREHEPSLSENDLPPVTARESSKAPPGRALPGDLQLSTEEPVPTLLDPVVGDDDDVQERPQKEQAPVEEVLVINVISRDPHGFRGPALLQNILESGLRFGEMDIFHRHESMAGNGEVLFSMANAVKPGTFDLDDIDHFTTPAVSFFLGLPGPRHPKQAFDVMVAASSPRSLMAN